MIKKHLNLIVLLGLALTLVMSSCGKKQHIYLSKNSVIITPAGGLRTIKVYSDCTWTVERIGHADWFTVDPMEGGDGDIISIRAGEYNEVEDRSATIRVVSENGKVKKNITNNGKATIQKR